MRPEPRSNTPAGTAWAVSRNTSSVAVVMRADLMCAGRQFGWASISSATAPATCGVAMLVPDCEPNPVNGVGKSPTAYPPETTSTPGATTSGLSVLSWVGPRELNAAMTSPMFSAACGANVNIASASPAGTVAYAATMASPCDRRMNHDGIVTCGAWTPGPMAWRLSPLAAELYTRAATAPACWALNTLVLNSQTPRSITAIAPASEPAGNAAQPSGLPPLATWAGMYGAGPSVVVTCAPNCAGPTGMSARAGSAGLVTSTTPGTIVEFFVEAPTAMTSGELAGELPVPWSGPELPWA